MHILYLIVYQDGLKFKHGLGELITFKNKFLSSHQMCSDDMSCPNSMKCDDKRGLCVTKRCKCTSESCNNDCYPGQCDSGTCSITNTVPCAGNLNQRSNLTNGKN